LNPCLKLPTLFLCEPGAKFLEARDLEDDGGLIICYHMYVMAQFSQHWTAQVRQVGHSLLDFAVKKVKGTDPCVLNWVEIDKMHIFEMSGMFLELRLIGRFNLPANLIF